MGFVQQAEERVEELEMQAAGEKGNRLVLAGIDLGEVNVTRRSAGEKWFGSGRLANLSRMGNRLYRTGWLWPDKSVKAAAKQVIRVPLTSELQEMFGVSTSARLTVTIEVNCTDGSQPIETQEEIGTIVD